MLLFYVGNLKTVMIIVFYRVRQLPIGISYYIHYQEPSNSLARMNQKQQQKHTLLLLLLFPIATSLYVRL